MGHASLADMKLALKRASQSAENWYPFLVMSISSKKCSIFRYDNQTFLKIDHGPESIAEVLNDIAEKVSNFSDQSARKQVVLDKFLHRIDDRLADILHADPLPVYVLGTKKVIGHFKKITKNTSSVIGYVYGNYDDLKPVHLLRIIQQYTRPI